MQYINPYELIIVENKIPQNELAKLEDQLLKRVMITSTKKQPTI